MLSAKVVFPLISAGDGVQPFGKLGNSPTNHGTWPLPSFSVWYRPPQAVVGHFISLTKNAPQRRKVVMKFQKNMPYTPGAQYVEKPLFVSTSRKREMDGRVRAGPTVRGRCRNEIAGTVNRHLAITAARKTTRSGYRSLLRRTGWFCCDRPFSTRGCADCGAAEHEYRSFQQESHPVSRYPSCHARFGCAQPRSRVSHSNVLPSRRNLSVTRAQDSETDELLD